MHDKKRNHDKSLSKQQPFTQFHDQRHESIVSTIEVRLQTQCCKPIGQQSRRSTSHAWECAFCATKRWHMGETKIRQSNNHSLDFKVEDMNAYLFLIAFTTKPVNERSNMFKLVKRLVLCQIDDFKERLVRARNSTTEQPTTISKDQRHDILPIVDTRHDYGAWLEFKQVEAGQAACFVSFRWCESAACTNKELTKTTTNHACLTCLAAEVWISTTKARILFLFSLAWSLIK